MNHKTNTLRSVKIGLIAFMLFFSNIAFADKVVNVSTEAELIEAVASASEPTEIVLASGNYGGGNIYLQNNSAPVTIHPATDFAAHFQSTVYIKGGDITITKCTFDGGGGVNVHGKDAKLLRNVWDNSTAADWIRIEKTALRLEIGYNQFKNRPGDVARGTQIIVTFLDDNTPEPYAFHIHHNHFKDIAPSSNSETQIILLYTAEPSSSLGQPECPDNNIIIEYNLFDSARGNGQAIDIKTNGVITRYNTFTGYGGTIQIRSGKRCTLDSNVFTNTSTGGGISASNRDNKIINNYIHTNYARGIITHCGTDATYYPWRKQMINTIIANNTIIGADNGLYLGWSGVSYDSGGEQIIDLPMIDTQIYNNLIIDVDTATTTGKVTHINTTWENNIYNGNGGVFANEMTQATDLNMVDTSGNGVSHPTSLKIGSTVDTVLTPLDVGPDKIALNIETDNVDPNPVVNTETTEEPTGPFIMSSAGLQ